MTTFLFALLCVALLADGYTTVRAGKAGAVEANPLLAKLLGKRPGVALLALKAGTAAWIGWELSKSGWHAGNDYLSAIIVLSLVMGYAAHNNLRIARKLEAK